MKGRATQTGMSVTVMTVNESPTYVYILRGTSAEARGVSVNLHSHMLTSNQLTTTCTTDSRRRWRCGG